MKTDLTFAVVASLMVLLANGLPAQTPGDAPSGADRALELAHAAFLNADFGEVRKQYMSVLEERPDCLEALSGMADFATVSGDHAGAAKLFARIAGLTATTGVEIELRAEALDKTGQVKEASEQYRLAAQAKAESLFERQVRASARWHAKQFALALEDANFILEHGNRPALGVYLHGVVHEGMGRYASAIQDYTEAIGKRADYAFAYNNRGFAHRLHADYKSAVQDYNVALGILPRWRLVYLNRSEALGRLKDFEAALADAKLANALEETTESRLLLGNCYCELGRYGEGLAEYGRALSIDPKCLEAIEARGVLYFRQKKDEQAIEEFNQAHEMDPSKGRPLLLRAEANRGLGRTEEASKDEEQYKNLPKTP